MMWMSAYHEDKQYSITVCFAVVWFVLFVFICCCCWFGFAVCLVLNNNNSYKKIFNSACYSKGKNRSRNRFLITTCSPACWSHKEWSLRYTQKAALLLSAPLQPRWANGLSKLTTLLEALMEDKAGERRQLSLKPPTAPIILPSKFTGLIRFT